MNRVAVVAEQVRTLGPIPKIMQAGVYRGKGVVRVEEVPVPEVGEGEVLIKVAACGVCGAYVAANAPGCGRPDCPRPR